MLHLNPGVHLKEIELAVVLIEYKFDGAGIFIADILGYGDGRFSNLLSQRIRYRVGRRFLHDLLVSALQRAITLAHVDRSLIPSYLDLLAALESDGPCYTFPSPTLAALEGHLMAAEAAPRV